MDKSEAIASVDDAIRKLVQLSSKDKIWTQEMLLQVDDRCVRLLDAESQVRPPPRAEEGEGWGPQLCRESRVAVCPLRLTARPQEELENFPLATVQLSQTVLNQLRYASVLLLVCQDPEQTKPDVHFFHCDEVEVRTRGGAAAVGPALRPPP